MSTVLWWWAAGCTDGEPLGVPAGPVSLHIEAVRTGGDDDDDDDDDDGARFSELSLSIEELVVDGEGPSGPESIAVLVASSFAPLASDDAIGFALELGPHRELEITVRLAALEGPALLAAGTIDDDLPFRLELDPLDLVFPVDPFEVTDEPLAGALVFRPDAWLGAFELDDDDEPLIVTPASGARYAALLDAVLTSTTLRFGGDR